FDPQGSGTGLRQTGSDCAAGGNLTDVSKNARLGKERFRVDVASGHVERATVEFYRAGRTTAVGSDDVAFHTNASAIDVQRSGRTACAAVSGVEAERNIGVHH